MQEVFENIIKALEEKRDEAEKNMELSDVLSEVNSYGGMFNAFDKSIEIVKQTAAEYNNGWIPCSERLPKYGEVVMCSCTNGGITISCITHKEVTPSKSVMFGQHSVIAWQPLPKSFQNGE